MGNLNFGIKKIAIRDYLAGITSKDIARRFIFPKKAIEAHDAGIIHIHKNIVA